jgi:hypothetical protein
VCRQSATAVAFCQSAGSALLGPFTVEMLIQLEHNHHRHHTPIFRGTILKMSYIVTYFQKVIRVHVRRADLNAPASKIKVTYLRTYLRGAHAHHVTRHNKTIHNILSTAPQLSISQKVLGMLPDDGNVMPKHVGATIHK